MIGWILFSYRDESKYKRWWRSWSHSDHSDTSRAGLSVKRSWTESITKLTGERRCLYLNPSVSHWKHTWTAASHRTAFIHTAVQSTVSSGAVCGYHSHKWPKRVNAGPFLIMTADSEWWWCFRNLCKSFVSNQWFGARINLPKSRDFSKRGFKTIQHFSVSPPEGDDLCERVDQCL